MSVFEFTTVLFGFVVALGLARVLGGIADLIQFWRQLINPYLFGIWFLLLVLLPIGWWTSIWRFSDSSSIPLQQLLSMFHVPVFMYIATRLLVPTESEFLAINKRYDSIRTPFAMCLGVPTIISPAIGFMTGSSEMVYLIIVGSLQISLPLTKNRKYDYFVAASSVVVYVAFIAQYRAVIGHV
ncbi:hypothetical protein N8993_14135 [Pseudomonadales bacterium]|jgi:hypothetical protein|nr:hypothetical protein [Pseudomonadales bacterium]|tara:strand:+ start:227 stop:775 length:549 start_codon:yes stop_codon:yes gene_type:complete